MTPANVKGNTQGRLGSSLPGNVLQIPPATAPDRVVEMVVVDVVVVVVVEVSQLPEPKPEPETAPGQFKLHTPHFPATIELSRVSTVST